MPTTIQNLIPVQRTVPNHPRPAESRSDERREDFRQMLDEASSRPAERAETATKPDKPGKTEAKKPGEKKPGGAASKVKASSKDAAADDDAVVTEAQGADVTGTENASDAADVSVDGEEPGPAPEATRNEDVDEEGVAKDGSGDLLMLDAATVAQAAASATPSADGDPVGESQNAGEGASDAAVDAIASGNGKPRPRVHAVESGASPAADDEAEDAPADGAMTSTDAAVTASPRASTGGESSESGTSDGQPKAATTPAGSKPSLAARAASTVSPLGGSEPVGAEAKVQKSPTAGASANPQAPDALAAVSQIAEMAGPAVSDEKAPVKAALGGDTAGGLKADATAVLTSNQPSGPQGAATPKIANPLPPQPPEVQFADANHDSIVTGVKAQLLPQGGSMQIRLDPPELGALKVMVEMRDGTMTATFQTSNDEATRLLSHSLNQLKHVLEGQGVSVERLQVQQAPRSDSHSAGDESKQQQQQQSQNWQDEHAARQEQQRKEMLRRMWRRVSGVSDPIDVTA